MAMGHKYLCGVPKEHCTGSRGILSRSVDNLKSHTTHKQAAACAIKNYERQGYIRTGQMTLASPNNGPTIMLGRLGQFGGELRPGKKGGRSANASRHMPAIRTGGLII